MNLCLTPAPPLLAMLEHIPIWSPVTPRPPHQLADLAAVWGQDPMGVRSGWAAAKIHDVIQALKVLA